MRVTIHVVLETDIEWAIEDGLSLDEAKFYIEEHLCASEVIDKISGQSPCLCDATSLRLVEKASLPGEDHWRPFYRARII